MIKHLAVGGAAVLALTGMSATGAVASTAGARPGVASRVMHVDIHGVKATVTLRGDWRLGKAMSPAERRRIEAVHKAASSVAYYNWGGYADTGHNVAFRFASADFTAPNVGCTSNLVYNGQAVVADVVGLGGLTTQSGEQVGFQQDCNPSETPDLSFASYYIVGTTAETITGAEPGDELAASVYYTSTGEYQLVVNDLTEPGGFSTTVACPGTCDNTSAEVLSNADGYDPQAPGSSYGLADYGASWFNATAVTSRAGTRGTLSANKLWSPTNIATVYPSGDTIQTAGNLLSGGTGFEETWKAVS
jgi:hypothetical protein